MWAVLEMELKIGDKRCFHLLIIGVFFEPEANQNVSRFLTSLCQILLGKGTESIDYGR
jgi:hypothetical protein